MSTIERLRRTAAAWTKETGDSGGIPALLNEAADAIAAQQDGGWRPIETAPKDTTLLLGWYCQARGHEHEWMQETGTAHCTRGRWLHGLATHWRPLPAGPEQ